MKVAVQGNKEFNDYNVFMRSMAVALSSLKDGDTRIEMWGLGPNITNGFLEGFCNLSEPGMKNRGMDIRFYRTSYRYFEDHIKDVDYFIYLSSREGSNSRLVHLAESNDLEVGIFRY